MSQPCAFVDPSSLSLPSSSIKRPPSPASSIDDFSPSPADEPPRKRPRSAVTPEERKEARAHRNRIAAQNSRDRRKAQFTYLERRVAELEEENRRLRAGILTPSPSVTTVSEPNTTVEHEKEQQRKHDEEQRERENHELRERIRTLEKGYEAVVRALAAQGNPAVTSGIPTPPATSPPSGGSSQLSQPTLNGQPSETQSSSSVNPSLSSAPSLPLSPTPSKSSLSPLLFAGSDPFEFPSSPALSATDTSLALPQQSLDLSLANNTLARHLARVANTVGRSTVSLQRAGGAQVVMGPASIARCRAVMRPRYLPEGEGASDADLTRLFAEILASPPLGSNALPSSSTSSEDAFSKEALTKIETSPSDKDLGLGLSGIGAADWVDQVRAEMEMEKLLEMLPNVEDVAVDAILNCNGNVDVDMDFSSALSWDGVAVS